VSSLHSARAVAVLIFFCAVGNFLIQFFLGMAKKHSLKNFGSLAGLKRFLRVCFLWVGFSMVIVEKFFGIDLSNQIKWL
jgi:hypothetical protein